MARTNDGYRPIQFRGFDGGLNIKSQPDVVKEDQAIDALNVDFTVAGGVKQRHGYGQLTSVEGTNRYDSIGVFYKTDGTKQIVCGAGNRLDAIGTTGAIVASSTSPTASPHFFTRFGGPTAERLYIANGTDTVRYWDGAAFTTPTYAGTTPNGKFLAVTGWDNRLAVANFIGSSASGNASSVIFSEPGDPATFKAGAPDNVYVQLTPGDGEQIMGMASWREYLFVFKESSFFVFYGTSVGANGYPIFNYRQVAAGVGLASPRALAVGRDGVYFMDRKGVYRTKGGEPELVSELVEPIFYGTPSDFYTGGTLSHGTITNAAMTWHEEKLYLGFASITATNDRTLVYDTKRGWWSLWNVPAGALASFRFGAQAELVFAYASGTKDIGRLGTSFTDDDGTPIVSRWRSGWFNYGNPTVKTIRESKLWGQGNFTFGVSKDFQAINQTATINLVNANDVWNDGTDLSDKWGDGTTADTWGATTSVVPRLVRLGIRGTMFSIQFQNSTSNRPWEIHFFENHLREQRPPNIVRTEA